MALLEDSPLQITEVADKIELVIACEQAAMKNTDLH